MIDETILVINCGSSSLKFALFSAPDLKSLASGLAENLGSAAARLKIKSQAETLSSDLGQCDHYQAILKMTEDLRALGLLTKAPLGIGHRVVHGGESFSQSTAIDQSVIKQIEKCSALSPVHNPANLLGIRFMIERYPTATQVAVFDTAFHQTLPEKSYFYPIPYELYQNHGVRRYGFHGTSHQYVARQAAQHLQKPLADCHLITAHLGNGCSVTAIRNGLSVDTSMGLTPLEGLMMGTRSGDIDPGLFEFLDGIGMNSKVISHMLYHDSGLKGLSGATNDMRTLLALSEQGHDRATLAIQVFCFKLAKYIAAMAVSLPAIDALIFTGGIGENASIVRKLAMQQLVILGYEADSLLNEQHGQLSAGRISTAASPLALVIATNEELMIAQDTLQISAYPIHSCK